jgi:signal transduction histidine kinase
MTHGLSEQPRLEPDYSQVVAYVGAVLRETDGDTLSLLERLGRALDVTAIMILRPRKKSVIAECAWLDDHWHCRRVTVRSVTPSMFESLRATEAVHLGADAAQLPVDQEWDAAWASTDTLAIGISRTVWQLSPDALRALATAIDVFVARELSFIASRMTAMMRERARIVAAIDQHTSKDCAAVGIQLDVLGSMVDVSSQAQKLVSEIKASTEAAMDKLKTAVHGQPPVSLRRVWSVEDLAQFVEDCASWYAVDVELETTGAGDVLDSDAVELVSVFIQESVGGHRPPGRSASCAVRAAFDDAHLHLTIGGGQLAHETNGRSGDVAGPGYVLRLMRTWARLLGGDVHTGRSGEETVVTLDLPL